MIFRPSVIAQPKPKRVNRKPIVSSLLTDPAFSADPYEHPYAVTSHEPWLTSPPAGHPTLRNSTRKAERVLADDSDNEPFHLIQPPNSPVNFAGPSDSLSISISNSTLSPTSSTQQSEESHSLPASSSQKPRSPVLTTEPSPSPSPPAPAPAPLPSAPPAPVDQKNSQRKPEKSFMTFLKRRSKRESSSVVSKPTNNNPSKEPRSARIGNNVTRVQAVPCHPTEPDLHNVERLVLPPRASTLGFSTPATVSASSLTGSALSKRRVSDAPNSRVKDLDSIDELDETNPWGIALHHGGPYEAAVQAIRGKSKQVYAGHGSYSRGAQALGSNYAPPQAIGLSLNLSPGQILPRNIYSLYGEATQPRQRAAPKDLVSPPMAVMMIPPDSSQNPPLPSFLQSGFTTPMQSSASLPQTHQGGPSTTPPRDHMPRSQPRDSKPAVQVNHPLPQNLPSAGSSARPPSTVPIVQPSSQPVLKKFSRKPVNQDHEKPVSNETSVSIGIGMAMLDGESEEDSEESRFESSASRDDSQTSLEANDFQQVDPRSEKPQLLVMAPDLSSPIDPPLESPPPPYVPQTNADRSQTSSQRSTNSSPSLTSANASDGNAAVSNVSLHAGRDGEVTLKTPITQSKQPNVRQGTSAGPPQPARGNTVRLHPGESDSIHQSISTLSSSQSRSVSSPRPRHIPKHLVMPAPLSQPNMAPQPRHREYRHTIHSRQSHYLPARQIPLQTVERPPRPLERAERMRPANTVVKAQAEEIPFASDKVAKLKKRVSMITPASPPSAPPIITTVSFAPPIIDFKNSVANDNGLQRVMMNKLGPRRVLSKRKDVW